MHSPDWTPEFKRYEELAPYRFALSKQYLCGEDKFQFSFHLANFFGTSTRFAELVGKIAELTMAAELILDDLADKSAFRKGQPAFHIRFGEEKTQEIVTSLRTACKDLCEQSHLEEKRLTNTWNQIAEGQSLATLKTNQAYPNYTTAIQSCRLRCGSLYRWIAMAHLQEKNDFKRKNSALILLTAENYGSAVQLRNDILDVLVEPGNPTKPSLSDLTHGQLNCVLALHYEVATRFSGEIPRLDRNTGAEVTTLAHLRALEELVESGALAKSIRNLETLVEVSQKELSDCLRSLRSRILCDLIL